MLRRLVRTSALVCALLLSLSQLAQARARVEFSFAAGRSVSGNIRLAAGTVGHATREVVFVIDGRTRWVARRRPFRFGPRGLLDTRRLRNGRHMLTVIALARHGRRVAVTRAPFTVRNVGHASRRRPAPVPAPVASGARAVTAFGPPSGGVPGASIAAFNRETYQYSSGLTLGQEAGNYQFIVLQATDGRMVSALHAANPNLRILVYQHPWASTPGDPAAWHVCTSYASDAAGHPDWFLRGPSGNALMTRGSGNYVMDIGNASYQQSCVSHMISLARQYGFDGVFIDDLPATWSWDLPLGASVPEYPSTSAWQSAVSSFVSYAGPTLHAAGLLAIGNLAGTTMTPGLWQQWSTPLDGSEEESWTDGGLGLPQQSSAWATKLANVAWSEAHGKYVLVHSYNTTQPGNTFGLASLLLVASGHSSYSTSNANYTSYEAFYPDYSVAAQLGAPAGPYVRLANGVYERAFSRGIVLVNPATRAVPTFSLGGGAYSGSGLAGARLATMGPTSGLILLKVG